MHKDRADGLTHASMCNSSFFPPVFPLFGSLGRYLKDVDAHTLPECTLSCCNHVDCNTVFLHGTTCFLLTCNTTHPENCEPQSREGDKFKDTYMLNLRTVG